MGYLLSFRFHPAGEEIINLLNEKGLDPDFSVQTIYKVDKYYFDPRQLFCKYHHLAITLQQFTEFMVFLRAWSCF
ncbi:hypothetical protein CISIN_1g037457mg [Citrus sinensis]|uniref:Uncharacterized protein n=1 Tax=Citrus sinensis TaxID=2711 RepID=A0A067FR74_CITSI|nr:hypothetical protein CISIN_1g037457mg [Citrus sinensis]